MILGSDKTQELQEGDAGAVRMMAMVTLPYPSKLQVEPSITQVRLASEVQDKHYHQSKKNVAAENAYLRDPAVAFIDFAVAFIYFVVVFIDLAVAFIDLAVAFINFMLLVRTASFQKLQGQVSSIKERP